MASHQGWENRSQPDFLSPSFQPAVNASQQESNNVVFPPWDGELQTSISTYLKCRSLSQSAFSLPLVRVWQGHRDAVVCGLPHPGPELCSSPRAALGYPGGLHPSGFVQLQVHMADVGEVQLCLQTWGVSSGCLCSLQVSPHPTFLHPFGQGHPLSPDVCVAATVFCFLMISKAFLSPSFSWRKK